MRAWPLAVALLIGVVQCSQRPSDPDPGPGPGPTPEPVPADIRVVDGSEGVGHGFGLEAVTLHLTNAGGPGTYAVEAWGVGNVFYGRTEAVTVDSTYDETATWEFQTGFLPGGIHLVAWVLVFSRDQGSALYRQTDRHDF